VLSTSLILISLLLAMGSVTLHAIGSTWWVNLLLRRFTNHGGYWKAHDMLLVWIMSALVLLLLHFAEIVVWAVTYLLLPDLPELASFEDALYFSLVTFTSLGFGDTTLAGPWRILSGIEAMTGILLFGWSTALLFLVVQRSWATVLSSDPNGNGSEAPSA
jgi:voltage-gated potassium channel Kch